MNKFILYSIGAFLFPIFLVSYLNFTSIDDLKLASDHQIYAGEGETCITPYTQINCFTGLKCILISTTPHINGICMKPETQLDYDFANRNENFIKNKTLDSTYADYNYQLDIK